jgi:hypothetical protein
MTRRLVVDDVRDALNFQAHTVRLPEEALKLIREQHWDEVWLDHDSDFVSKLPYSWVTARLANDALEGRKADVGMFVLHSANTTGRKWMRKHLERYFKVIEVEEYPGDTDLIVSGHGMVVDASTHRGMLWQEHMRVLNRRERRWKNSPVAGQLRAEL